MKLHFGSMCAGMGMLVVVFLAGSASQVSVGGVDEIPASAFGDTPIQVIGIPDPRDIIVLRQADHPLGGGTPYLVPSGKILVLTAIGKEVTGFVSEPRIYVDGGVVYSSGNLTAGTMLGIPSHLTIASNSAVTLSDSGSRAWGYLIDE